MTKGRLEAFSDGVIAIIITITALILDAPDGNDLAALMTQMPLDRALAVAADYTVACIKTTIGHADHNWYGVDFESEIPYLLELMGK